MTHPAYQKMLDFNKAFGTDHAKAVYQAMQNAHLQSRQKQVFYPLQAILQTILSQYPTLDFKKQLINANALHLFGAWRNTLSIYKLDENIIKETLKSPIPIDTPTNIFKNLPEWAVYIDLSANTDPDIIQGFWAVFDEIILDDKYLSLNIIFDNSEMIPLNFLIDDEMTVEQSVIKISQLTFDDSDDIFEVNAENAQKTTLLRQALSCLLWLCVQEPDLVHRGEPVGREHLTRQKYGINKKTGAFVPPNQPHFYEIGARLGGELRKYEMIIGDKKHIKSSQKRPHIRRGHWHGYWHGTGQAKEFKVKWQPAIFVNASI